MSDFDVVLNWTETQTRQALNGLHEDAKRINAETAKGAANISKGISDVLKFTTGINVANGPIAVVGLLSAGISAAAYSLMEYRDVSDEATDSWMRMEKAAKAMKTQIGGAIPLGQGFAAAVESMAKSIGPAVKEWEKLAYLLGHMTIIPWIAEAINGPTDIEGWYSAKAFDRTMTTRGKVEKARADQMEANRVGAGGVEGARAEADKIEREARKNFESLVAGMPSGPEKDAMFERYFAPFREAGNKLIADAEAAANKTVLEAQAKAKQEADRKANEATRLAAQQKRMQEESADRLTSLGVELEMQTALLAGDKMRADQIKIQADAQQEIVKIKRSEMAESERDIAINRVQAIRDAKLLGLAADAKRVMSTVSLASGFGSASDRVFSMGGSIKAGQDVAKQQLTVLKAIQRAVEKGPGAAVFA